MTCPSSNPWQQSRRQGRKQALHAFALAKGGLLTSSLRDGGRWASYRYLREVHEIHCRCTCWTSTDVGGRNKRERLIWCGAKGGGKKRRVHTGPVDDSPKKGRHSDALPVSTKAVYSVAAPVARLFGWGSWCVPAQRSPSCRRMWNSEPRKVSQGGLNMEGFPPLSRALRRLCGAFAL